ncbi:hypothetical protein [Cystobacter fuscus]|uniref:hypothetical protein n=1 Tax=Cystobacter fuscus TaxID=43 RepID=UPI000BB3D077|nr:hypothetical protein [Cystobacter fuscus]
MLPYGESGRKAQAIQIANDPGQIAARLETILQAVTSNNPVIFYSGFSTEKSAPIHLILIIGYAYITDDNGRHLWLAVADPATHGNKISARKGAAIFFPPTADAPNDVDAVAERKLTHEHDLIRVIPGAWEEAQGALILIRARKLFEENPFSRLDDLFMDYWSDGAKGGTFIYSHKSTRVPPDFVYTNVMRSVSLPLDGQQMRFRPVNGYVTAEQSEMGLFPFGGHRTLHSGVHLERSQFPARPPPPPPSKKPEETKAQGSGKGAKSTAQPAPPVTPTNQREVRCLAPGHIVALRLTNALPAAESSEAAKAGREKNKLAQELVGNHNSFVLVRHDVEVIPPKDEDAQPGAGTPERFTFYSLYMHLMPPDWKDANTYRDVAWLKTLARREGSLVVIDPKHPAFGQVRWLQPPSEASSPVQEDILLKSGGEFSVIGAGLGLPEPLELGEGTEGVSAVWRKPDRDVTELHEALIAGKVVTLAHPFLMVRAGEVLGYLDDKSRAMGDGFLHWEILAPSQNSSIEKLLKFTEQKLGLSAEGAPFFKFFEEKDRNNFFEPPQDESGKGNEVIDQVLALAPESKHANGPDYARLKHFRNTYSEETLQEILTTYTTLPFSSEEPESSGKGIPDEPSYPVDLLITNYKDSLPPGAYQLKLTFEPPSRELLIDYDGKQTHLRIRLPANARKVFVEPADPSRLLLQTGSGGGQDALKRDAAHFKNVASVRWRNVVLRHLNAWIPEGIAKQVEAQLRFYEELQIGKTLVNSENEEAATRAIKELSDVVGWWAHQETVVLGVPGQEKSLFAAQPNGEQLPKDTLLDNPHPVTFAWLLMLLTNHGLVRFSDTRPWLSDEAKALSAIGWVPARPEYPPMRVGEHIYLAAIQRGGATESVTARVSHEQRTYELPLGKAREGTVMYPLEFPGWGTWKLDATGVKALGGLELTGLEPVLLSARNPAGLTSHEDGSFSWRIPFRDHCPKSIRGWVLLRVASAEDPKKLPPKKPGRQKPGAEPPAPAPPLEFQVAAVAIPVEGRESLAFSEARGFQVIDGYVKRGAVKDASTYVSQHFTYKAFLDAAAKDAKGAASTEPLLAWELVDAVERIQCMYGPRQALALTALSGDGLSIVLRSLNPDVLRQVVARAKDEGWIQDAEEAGKGAVLIRVKEPQASQHPGEIVIEFDAHEAFSALRKTLQPEKKLVVQFGCLFPNGGHLHDPRLSRTETLGKRAEKVDVEELRGQASAGHLELWSTVEAEELHQQPSFGVPEVQLTSVGIQITVPLLGADERFWKATAPVIKTGQDKLDVNPKSTIQASAHGLGLVRQVRFDGDVWKDEELKDAVLRIFAEAKNKRVPLETERIDVEPSKTVDYDTQRGAELELKPRPDDPFVLGVSLKTFAVPSGRSFKLELVAPADGEGGAPRPLKLAKNTLVYKSMVKGYGVTRPDGILQAEVNLRDVSVALKGGQRFTVRAVPVAKGDADLRTEAEGSLPEPLQQPAMQDVHDSFQGMWPVDGINMPMKSEGMWPP